MRIQGRGRRRGMILCLLRRGYLLSRACQVKENKRWAAERDPRLVVEPVYRREDGPRVERGTAPSRATFVETRPKGLQSESSTEGQLREPRNPNEPEVTRVRSDNEASCVSEGHIACKRDSSKSSEQRDPSYSLARRLIRLFSPPDTRFSRPIAALIRTLRSRSLELRCLVLTFDDLVTLKLTDLIPSRSFNTDTGGLIGSLRAGWLTFRISF
jgi:hypothetical protein